MGCSDVSFQPAQPLPPESSGVTKTDTFMFNDDRPMAQVDVLFVIDNSGSMADEQQRLAQRLASFVGTLSTVDWKIGITTTDVSNGPFGLKGALVNFVGTSSRSLNRDTVNYGQAFLNTVTANGTPTGCGNSTAPSCPSGDEQPLAAINLAIGLRNSGNSGFFRADADLATIVLSDEDEHSDGSMTKSPTTPQQVVNTVKAAWGNEKAFTGYGIIIEPGDSACKDISRGNYGTFVTELAQITGGTTGSICDEDYSTALQSIGQRVKQVATYVKLTERPTPGTVHVRLTPDDPRISWTLRDTERKVQLSDTPKRGTRVDVTYDIAK